MSIQKLRHKNRYRSELTITYHILQAIKEKGSGIMLTHIARQKNIDNKKLSKTLNYLKASNIISEEIAIVSHIHTRPRRLYKLTQNGFLFIRELEKFHNFLTEYNLEMIG